MVDKVDVIQTDPYFYETPDLPSWVKQKSVSNVTVVKADTQTTYREEDEKNVLIDPSYLLHTAPLYKPVLKEPDKVSEIKQISKTQEQSKPQQELPKQAQADDLRAREIHKDEKQRLQTQDRINEAIVERQTMDGLKKAIASREEGAHLLTQDFVKNHKLLQTYKTQFEELEDMIAKRKGVSKVLEWVNTGLTLGTVAIAIGAVALAVATAGVGAVIGVLSAVGMAAKGVLTAVSGGLKLDAQSKNALLKEAKEHRAAHSKHLHKLMSERSQEEQARHFLYMTGASIENQRAQTSPFKNQ